MLYVQDRVINSDVLDEYGLINRAQTVLKNENINSVEQAIEELESETELNEQWTPVENSDRIREQAKNLLAMGFDAALGEYIGDQAEGMTPVAVGLTDLTFSRDKSFAEKNVDDAIEFYEAAQSHSLNSAIDIWIDQNYLNAVGKVVTWDEIVNIYVENAIETIHSELPDMYLNKLRSYLIAHIDEVQKGWPHYNQIIETLKENDEPQVLDEQNIHEQVRLSFEDNLRYMGWDEEHFQRAIGESISSFINELTYCILAGYDDIDEEELEKEVDYQMEEFEDNINYEYMYDIDEKFEKYAQEHDWNEYSLSPAEDVNAASSDKLSEWADNIELFIQDNYPELLETNEDSNREELLEKAHQKLGNFEIAAVYDPDTSDFDSFLEDVNIFNNVSDAIDEYLEPDVDEWIDGDDDFFENYLPNSNEEYADLSLNAARAKYLQEEPNCATYLQYLKQTMDLESVVESVGFNDIFYNADEIVDYYIESK